jgi:hypothetical protein
LEDGADAHLVLFTHPPQRRNAIPRTQHPFLNGLIDFLRHFLVKKRAFWLLQERL